jgi:hypothetical protein
VPKILFLVFVSFFVDVLAEKTCRFRVRFQLWVLEIVRTDSDVARRLDHGLTRRRDVQIDLAVLQFSASQLSTTHGDLAVAAVSQENRRLDRTDKENAVVAAIYFDVGGMVHDHDEAVVQVFDHKRNAVDFARHFDESGILLRFEHVIFFVQLFLLRHDWLNLFLLIFNNLLIFLYRIYLFINYDWF